METQDRDVLDGEARRQRGRERRTRRRSDSVRTTGNADADLFQGDEVAFRAEHERRRRRSRPRASDGRAQRRQGCAPRQGEREVELDGGGEGDVVLAGRRGLRTEAELAALRLVLRRARSLSSSRRTGSVRTDVERRGSETFDRADCHDHDERRPDGHSSPARRRFLPFFLALGFQLGPPSGSLWAGPSHGRGIGARRRSSPPWIRSPRSRRVAARASGSRPGFGQFQDGVARRALLDLLEHPVADRDEDLFICRHGCRPFPAERHLVLPMRLGGAAPNPSSAERRPRRRGRWAAGASARRIGARAVLQHGGRRQSGTAHCRLAGRTREPGDRNVRVGGAALGSSLCSGDRSDGSVLDSSAMRDPSARFSRYLQVWWERQLQGEPYPCEWLRGRDAGAIAHDFRRDAQFAVAQATFLLRRPDARALHAR